MALPTITTSEVKSRTSSLCTLTSPVILTVLEFDEMTMAKKGESSKRRRRKVDENAEEEQEEEERMELSQYV